MSKSNYDLGEMKAIIDEFVIETGAIVDQLDSDLVELENQPGNRDLLNEIFRGIHTIKGTSGFLGFDDLMRLTHRMEDVLNLLRKNEIGITADIMDVLLEALDRVKLMLQNIAGNGQSDTNPTEIIERLKDIYNNKNKPADRGSIGPAGLSKFSKHDRPLNAKSSGSWFAQRESSTIRVSVENLKKLEIMIEGLASICNSLSHSFGEIRQRDFHEKEHNDLNQAIARMQLLATELHAVIKEMRRLPLSSLFNKFPRLVRDLSRTLKKEVDLIISGDKIELDNLEIEKINDPLIHLMRNAIDHGIENPDERQKTGKPRRGRIELSAYQEGNDVIIEVRDDGRGMDVEAIKKKAIECGLTTKAASERLSEMEILAFIFQPGLSTASKATSVSGRGVGLDIVRTNVEKLKGVINISSKRGEGSVITIELPLLQSTAQELPGHINSDVLSTRH